MKHEIEGPARTARKADDRAAVHADRGIPPHRLRDLRGVALDDGGGARRLLDEVGGCRPAAHRFETERARAGVEIQHRGPAQRVGGLQRTEQRLAHAIARRPGAGVGDLERDRSGAARDDACHTLTIAGASLGGCRAGPLLGRTWLDERNRDR